MPGNGYGDPQQDEHLSTSPSPQHGDPVLHGQITSAYEHQEDHASDRSSAHISACDEASNPQVSTPKHVVRRVASGRASNKDLDPLSEQAPQVSTLRASDNAHPAPENPRRSAALPNLSIDTRKIPTESSLVRNSQTLPLIPLIQGVREHDKLQWETSLAQCLFNGVDADSIIHEGGRAVKIAS